MIKANYIALIHKVLHSVLFVNILLEVNENTAMLGMLQVLKIVSSTDISVL